MHRKREDAGVCLMESDMRVFSALSFKKNCFTIKEKKSRQFLN